MTKEEFEKKFKIGDDVIVSSVDNSKFTEKIIYIGNSRVCTVDEDEMCDYWDYDSYTFQKVGPVKKYWKTKFIQKWHTKPTEEVIIRFLNVKCDQKKLEELLGDKVTLIEEPEQIELKDI